MKDILNFTFVLLILMVPSCANADNKITVFAAASLSNAMADIANAYKREIPVQIQTSFAASSVLAKQIENGAPTDIYVSADVKWMDYLEGKNLINTVTRVDLVGNHLVLIAPKSKMIKVDMDKNFNFADAFEGRLCTGETESVPAGIYAKQSLKYFGWWDGIKKRIVGLQDVRAALMFVERGECAAGIVYQTDAKSSSKVEIVAVWPDSSHDAVIYPLALVKGASPQSIGLYEFLKSEKAGNIFTRYGFSALVKD